MKNLGIYPNITKNYILDKVSQEEIMFKFLGFPVDNQTLQPNSITSPYRADRHPSCNYYYNPNGKIRFRDHTTGLNYDCFDVVAHTLGTSSSTKQGFMSILKEIAKAFRINKYESYEEVLKYEIEKAEYKPRVRRSANLVQYKVILRESNYHDASYWGRGKLKVKDLRGVFFIKRLLVSYNNKPYKFFYEYDPKDPCYGYYGKVEDRRKIHLWKFYYPLRIKGSVKGERFYTNGSFIQGLQYLKPDRVCILTKSFKDVKIFNKVGLQSCSVSAETIEPNIHQIYKLKSMFDYVVTCFDYDRTGMIMANKLRKKYNFTPIMFTNGLFNTIDYKVKDAFEYCNTHTLEDLRFLVLEYYSKHRNDIKKYEPQIINFNNDKY